MEKTGELGSDMNIMNKIIVCYANNYNWQLLPQIYIKKN